VGLPHLVDPLRLVSSATRIYGDRMDELWGPIVPVPSDRVDALRDGETVRAGGRRLRSIFTAGHAAHHAALFDESSGTLFSGDAGGVRVQGTGFVSPPTPPPEFDRDAWRSSIWAMRDARPARLALSHFGFFGDVEAHLDRLERSLDDVTRIARETLTPGSDTTLLTDRLLEYERQGGGERLRDTTMTRLELANPAFMGALGLRRFLRKRGELG
ncbi:MAG: MBL fold metallo-hydrolase, partial [Chloroflexia bacterium]|nr:MBL fold metallo-hydrolase [Chloroflexia bacterium]